MVTWKLTSSTDFGSVESELVDLNKRFEKQQKKPTIIIIDNCCHWNRKLKKVFGEETEIKLDLFHAVQRITSTISKKMIASHTCIGEFSHCFVHATNRTDGPRQSPTPSPQQILSNVDDWVNKWQRIKEDGVSVFGNKNAGS